ncbi:MAG: electron transport complex subunit RsxC [Promethearchaeota archaeon]|nr:MAG: electron transport complex subunit RsxC [Candidatus Lokiarchaeota archaeon]
MVFREKSDEKESHHFKEKGRFKLDLHMKMDAIDKPYKKVPPADKMVVFLRQNMGVETKPIVEVGESVKYGQKIGEYESGGPMVVPVHSPVEGTIMEIKKMEHPGSGKKENAILIKTISESDKPNLDPIQIEDATKEELLKRIREAGIVGLGGAAFPTHVKLSPNKKVSHLIINAKESDPNIACDFRLMKEKPKEIISGIIIMAKILMVEKIVFATRIHEEQLAEFDTLLKENNIEITRIHHNYSVGSEKLLVKEILNREVPCGKYPPDVGVVVHNISTAYAVSRAIEKGEPLVSRGLTLYSEKKGGQNLWVRMGTPISHILNYAGISPTEFNRIVLGSLMMGFTIPNSSYPTLKATSGITAFTQEQSDPYSDPLDCIRCGYCNIVCPVDIYPQMIMEAEKKGNAKMLKKLHVEDCIECGLCSYVCPSKIKFTKYLIGGKNRILSE